MFDDKIEDNNKKWKDPENIIKIINDNDNTCKMIRIYIYKILYNKYK